MPKTPQQIADKYKNRIAQSGQAYKDGVQGTSKSWSNNYSQAAPLMAQRFAEAVANQKPQNAARALGDEGYKRKTIEKADRYASAATRAADGYARVAPDIMNAALAGQQAANNISRDTQSNRWQRAIANGDTISEYWRQKRG